MKQCSDCGLFKPEEEFHLQSSATGKRVKRCKLCAIAKVQKWQVENPEQYAATTKRQLEARDSLQIRARIHNIHVEDLQNLYDSAGGLCQICQREPARWPVVDHNHDTGIVRGILCERCNQALGLFADNIDYLAAAIKYLQAPALQYRSYVKPPRRQHLDPKPPAICSCGSKMTRKATRCQKCNYVAARDVGAVIDWPSDTDLLDMVQDSSYRQVGLALGVADNTVRKRLKRRGLV